MYQKSLRENRSPSYQFECLEARTLCSFGDLDTIFQAKALMAQAAVQVVDPNGAIVVAIPTSTGADLRRFGPTGRLDRTFASPGRLAFESVSAVAGLRNGDLVLAINKSATTTTVERLSRTGQLDKSFGTAGSAVIPILVNSIAVQTDGTLVVAFTTNDTNQVQLMRLHPNGKVDSTFGASGVATVTLPDLGAGTTFEPVVVLRNGDIAVSGNQTDSFGERDRGVIARFTSAGKLDAGFGNDGIDILPTPYSQPGNAGSADITFQADGGFLVVYDGTASAFEGPDGMPVSVPGQQTRVYRFQSNGSLDPSFGISGFTDLPNAPVGGGYHIFVVPGHKIILVGGIGPQFNGSAATTYITRLNSNGSVDTSFGSVDGQPSIGTKEELPGNPVSVFELNRGKILVVTNNSPPSYSSNLDDVVLARYDANGNLDTTYGHHGVAVDPFGMSGGTNALALAPNKEVVAAGSEQGPTANQPTEAALVKYHADGTLDTTFGVFGLAITPLGSNASFGAVAVAANGDIYAAASGDAGSPSSPMYELYCFKPDGPPNRKFGVRGHVMFDGTISDITLQVDGDILVSSSVPAAGVFSVQTQGIVSRYLPNGKLDARFGSAGRAGTGNVPLARGLLIAQDGSILVGTNTGPAKLSSKGVLDASFGVNVVAATIGAIAQPGVIRFSDITAIALAPGGDIIAVSGQSCVVGRFLSNGQLDPTFGSGGLLQLEQFADPRIQQIQSIAVRSDGAIVLGVKAASPEPLSTNATDLLGLMLVDPAGVVDPNVQSPVNIVTGNGINDTIPALIIQPDDMIVYATNTPNNGVDVPSNLFRVLGK